VLEPNSSGNRSPRTPYLDPVANYWQQELFSTRTAFFGWDAESQLSEGWPHEGDRAIYLFPDQLLALYEVAIRESAAKVCWYCTLARSGAASIISVTAVTNPSFASSTVCGPSALGVKSGSCQT
jgi:hypothetical protein